MPIAKKQTFQQHDPLWAIIISIVLSSVFMVYPVSYELSAWRPLFMLLVMIFWILCQPAWCGVWFAFALGLFTDLLMELPLGVSALSYTMLGFAARYFTRDKRIMTFSNLWTITAIIVFVHLVLLWLLLIMLGEEVQIVRHWQPFVISVLIWPLIYSGLKKWRAV